MSRVQNARTSQNASPARPTAHCHCHCHCHCPYERVPYHQGLSLLPFPRRWSNHEATRLSMTRTACGGAALCFPIIENNKRQTSAPGKIRGGLPVSFETTRAECTVQFLAPLLYHVPSRRKFRCRAPSGERRIRFGGRKRPPTRIRSVTLLENTKQRFTTLFFC